MDMQGQGRVRRAPTWRQTDGLPPSARDRRHMAQPDNPAHAPDAAEAFYIKKKDNARKKILRHPEQAPEPESPDSGSGTPSLHEPDFILTPRSGIGCLVRIAKGYAIEELVTLRKSHTLEKRFGRRRVKNPSGRTAKAAGTDAF